MRSEGNRLLEAVDELIRIAREANIPAEIYHLKAAGERTGRRWTRSSRWSRSARSEGLQITADMYTYPAGATGLDAAMPPWAQEGGTRLLYKRLRDPDTRKKIAAAIRTPTDDWENLYLAAGSPERVLLVEFKNEALKPLTGKSLAEVAQHARQRIRSRRSWTSSSRIESRVGTVYFMMSEDNLKKQIRLPWVSFGSDAASMATEGLFLNSSTHPRAYGNFARLLGKYVRDEKVITLEEAIRRLTSLPASNLDPRSSGAAAVPATSPTSSCSIRRRSRIARRSRSRTSTAVGVKHVFVNGVQVLKDGEHTGAKPGRALLNRR